MYEWVRLGWMCSWETKTEIPDITLVDSTLVPIASEVHIMGYILGFPPLPRFPAYSLKNIAEICQTSFRLIRLTMAPLDNLTANSSWMEQVHFFLKNGRCHISLTALTRANVVRDAKRFFLKGETMFYRFDDQASPWVALETRSEVEAALRECHDDSGSGGHRGVTITLRKLEMSYYWKTTTADVRNWVKECPQCQHSHKLLTAAPELHPIQTDGAWDVVGINLMGPYAETTAGNKYIFTATDLFTKFVFARPVNGKSAGDVASMIVEMFYAYGSPRRVITDRGGEFVNELNDVILKAFGVRHSITSPYHPA